MEKVFIFVRSKKLRQNPNLCQIQDLVYTLAHISITILEEARVNQFKPANLKFAVDGRFQSFPSSQSALKYFLAHSRRELCCVAMPTSQMSTSDMLTSKMLTCKMLTLEMSALKMLTDKMLT
jgi:hypothetical protein